MSANEKIVNEKPSQGKKHRSPGYPLIDVGDAVNRLRMIYQRDRRAFTSYDAILEHLGYNVAKRSGTSGRIVAAIRQYGLLDEKGGQFRVSDLGFKILNLEEGSEERARLIKEAALKPAMFRKVGAFYSGEIPSDAALRSHLILNEKFNPDSVDQFIQSFRETIAVANLQPEDYTGEEIESSEPQGERLMQQSPANKPLGASGSQSRNDSTPPPPPAGQLHFPLYLSKDHKAALYVPDVMSRREYELLKRQIENSLAVMEATAVVDNEGQEPKPEQQRERNAIWPTNGFEHGVRVIGEPYTKADGKRYVKAFKGQESVEIPESELRYI